MVFGLDSEVFKDGVRPETFHMILDAVSVLPSVRTRGVPYPVLYLAVSNGVV